MEGRSNSNEHLPEVAPARHFSSQHPYEDYEYYEPQPPAPAPEYQQYPATPSHSTQQSPRLTSDRTTSPTPGDSLRVNTAQKERPLSPSTAHYSEYSATGLQSVYDKEGEKEVSNKIDLVGGVSSQSAEQPSRPSRICGLSKKWFFVLAALIICAIIGLAVGLGVGLGQRSNPTPTQTPPPPTTTPTPTPTPTADPDDNIGGALNPQYFSTTGAFNGSGIAIASVNFGGDSSIFVYYQHYTGEIRYSVLEADGTWTNSTVVASNARNGTPISAVAYSVNQTAQWHIFYIDENLHVAQRTSTNRTFGQENVWQDGPLNRLNLVANNASMIGLQACYWGNFYGDTDLTYANGFNSTNVSTTSTGMHLWYADTDTSFRQYSWYTGDDQWDDDNQTWTNMNGHAGVGCQTWLSGSVSYVFMVDDQNTVEVWWKDSNSSNQTPTHPTEKWVNTSIAIPNVHPSSSLGYTNYLCLQYGDDTIRGYNISWAAENTTIFPAKDGGEGYDDWIIPYAPAIPGTHMSITALADKSGGAHIDMLFQTQGTDIAIYSRDDTSGLWTSSEVPVNM